MDFLKLGKAIEKSRTQELIEKAKRARKDY